MQAFLPIVALVALSTAACGPGRVSKCPVNNHGSCDTVKMSEEESAQADAWQDEGAKITLMTERCAYWTKRLSEVPPASAGLTEFVQYRRVYECASADVAAQQKAKTDALLEKAGVPWERLTAGEISSGTCTPEHKEALEKVLFRLKTNLAIQRDNNGTAHLLTFVDYQIIVAKPEPQPFKLDPFIGSEIHVFEISALPAELDARRGSEAITLKSPWQQRVGARATWNGWESTPDTALWIDHPKLGRAPKTHVESRALQMRTGERLDLSIRGRGCTLIAVFRGLG